MSENLFDVIERSMTTEQLEELLTKNLTLPDLIRAGGQHFTQSKGWGCGSEACALSAAAATAHRVGFFDAPTS